MQELSLLLYSRQGCCLCEGLEEALGQVFDPKYRELQIQLQYHL